MNGYDLTRTWYNYKFENPSKVKAKHSDMFFYIVDLWNRLAQKKEFGLPTSITMEALGIGSFNTYKKTLQDLIDFGFINMVLESKNQHQAKVVAISKIDKATDKPLDKATIKATDKPLDKSLDSINKQLNKGTIEQINKQTKVFCDFVNNNLDLIFKEKIEDVVLEEKVEDAFLKNLCNYFSLTNENLERNAWSFLNSLRNKNKYSEFKTQFLAYKKYKEISEEKIHSWFGYQADWDKQVWVDKLSKEENKQKFKPELKKVHSNR